LSREELLFAIIDQVRANQVLTDLLDESASAYLGINRSDARAIDVIDRQGRITAGWLAHELRMSTGAVTTLVDRLERAGFARRVADPTDRRRVLIEVTPVVSENAEQIYGTYTDVLPAYEDWTEDELRVVLRFQQFGRQWLEERLANLDELRRRQQPRRAAASATPPAKSPRRPS
jgi:DNA-binding MarR family transcriptional regulator